MLSESGNRQSDFAKRLIVFTRYPEPGRVKTRLISRLGPERAAELHRRLTLHTLALASEVAAQASLQLTICYEGGSLGLMRDCFGHDFQFAQQHGSDLGERLESALADACFPTLIIGTDCPTLSADDIHSALAALRRADVVIGPAVDGGYYLIGVNRPQPSLFQQIPWGTDRVFEITLRHARDSGLKAEILRLQSDIDRPQDLDQMACQFEFIKSFCVGPALVPNRSPDRRPLPKP